MYIAFNFKNFMNKKYLDHIYIKKTTKEEVFFLLERTISQEERLGEQKKYIIDEKEQVELESIV